MARLFGTDGVRGIANVQLTNKIAYRLGQAAVLFLGKTIVVGKDTRLSGDMLESAMVAGIESAGGTALLAGIIPTPAVALLVRKLNAAGGAVISASHNPPEYNGIKLFDSQGYKLPDAVEDNIEAFIREGGLEGKGPKPDDSASKDESSAGESQQEAIQENPAEEALEHMPQGVDLGFAVPLNDAKEIYISHAVTSITDQGITFDGMTIALDTGHGASSDTSPEALRRLGADVHAINTEYDGTDINVNCGSTHLEPLKDLVKETNADVGVAHDGDADRVMMVTSKGDEIDGDMMEAVLALDMKERGKLAHDTIVTTIMSNLGLKRAMEDAGITVVQTKVGDRYVLEEMQASGYSIGGEQSGHMIMLDHNSTGDGLMTAVQFLAAVKRANKTVEDAISVMRRYPQVLINVHVKDKHSVAKEPAVQEAVLVAEEALAGEGRVLLRASGTEPVIRVMVEATDEQLAQQHAEAIAKVVEQF